MTIIDDRPHGMAVQLAELREFQTVLGYLVWRDLKVRYRQTVLGIAWAILQPLLLAFAFGIFFGRLAHVPSDGAPYPLFAFAALVPWVFVSSTVQDAGSSMVSSPDLLTKVFVPRLFIPLASILAGCVDLGVNLIVLLGLMLRYDAPITARLFLLVPAALPMMVVAAAVGTWMAALNVKYRDVRYALPFLIQLWMFATPVIYPMSIVPTRWRHVQELNPLTGIVGLFRSAVLGTPIDLRAFGISVGVAVVMGLLSMRYFGKVEQGLADVV